MTTAQQAADRIALALRPIDDGGQSHGGPDGWSPTAEEIREWQDYFRECASPEALRALLAERDELAKDAARWRFIRDEAVWRADPDGRGEMLWAVVGTRHDDCTPIDGAELDAACDERIAALTPKD